MSNRVSEMDRNQFSISNVEDSKLAGINEPMCDSFWKHQVSLRLFNKLRWHLCDGVFGNARHVAQRARNSAEEIETPAAAR